MKTASKIYTAIIFIFLFAPIAILLVFSFNEAKSLSVFSGFSLKWYQELFRDSNTLASVKNTLILAAAAMAISTVMGTAASMGIYRLRSRWYRRVMDTVTDIPMTNPDIITGISLMLMFVFAGRLLGLRDSLSFWTMLIAHVTFCLPYVILQVLPKLQQMDPALPVRVNAAASMSAAVRSSAVSFFLFNAFFLRFSAIFCVFSAPPAARGWSRCRRDSSAGAGRGSRRR